MLEVLKLCDRLLLGEERLKLTFILMDFLEPSLNACEAEPWQLWSVPMQSLMTNNSRNILKDNYLLDWIGLDWTMHMKCKCV